MMTLSAEEKAEKALRLNGFPYENSYNFQLRVKPTIRIKRLNLGGIKLKGASSIQRQLLDRERINAEKALKLNSNI